MFLHRPRLTLAVCTALLAAAGVAFAGRRAVGPTRGNPTDREASACGPAVRRQAVPPWPPHRHGQGGESCQPVAQRKDVRLVSGRCRFHSLLPPLSFLLQTCGLWTSSCVMDTVSCYGHRLVLWTPSCVMDTVSCYGHRPVLWTPSCVMDTVLSLCPAQ